MGAALFGISLAAYLLSGAAFLAALVSGRKRLDAAGFALQGVGLAAGSRWRGARRATRRCGTCSSRSR